MKRLMTIELAREQFRPRSGVRPTKTILNKRDKSRNHRKTKHKKNHLD